MKRLRQMTSIKQLTEQIARSQENPSMREAMLKTLPNRVFGPTVAKQITRIEVVGPVLYLGVPDATWRKELKRWEKVLLEKVRTGYPDAVCIKIEPR